MRVGLERRWRVRLADGRAGLLAQLLPELARDEALRRRYVQDLERLRALEAPVMAEIVAIGPPARSRATPRAAPPWRLRVDPPGETLEALLSGGAPWPVDEALAIGRRAGLRPARGAPPRGHPARSAPAPRRPAARRRPRLLFTDVGLARVDVLSTRTAASVVLEGSPYNAPEQLRSGAVDARADLYSWGVIVWRALTGTFPFGDGPAILQAATVAARRCTSCAPACPLGLSPLLARCLARDPGARPRSARELLDVLGGDPRAGAPRGAAASCSARPAGSALRPGLRLCPACGHAAVQFTHVRLGATGTASPWI